MIDWWRTSPNWQRWMVLGLVMGVFGLGMYTWIWAPREHAIALLTRDIADLDQKNQQAIKAIAELKDVEREVGMLREKLDSTFQHISVGPESLTFRRDVVTIGKQTGVSIRLWNPQKTVLKSKASDTGLTIIVRVEGSFHGTVQFLEKVLRLPWIQTVNPLMLISKPNTGNVSLVTTDFTIKGLQPQRLLPMKDRLKT